MTQLPTTSERRAVDRDAHMPSDVTRRVGFFDSAAALAELMTAQEAHDGLKDEVRELREAVGLEDRESSQPIGAWWCDVGVPSQRPMCL